MGEVVLITLCLSRLSRISGTSRLIGLLLRVNLLPSLSLMRDTTFISNEISAWFAILLLLMLIDRCEVPLCLSHFALSGMRCRSEIFNLDRTYGRGPMAYSGLPKPEALLGSPSSIHASTTHTLRSRRILVAVPVVLSTMKEMSAPVFSSRSKTT